MKRTYFNVVTSVSQDTLSALWRNNYSQMSEEWIVQKEVTDIVIEMNVMNMLYFALVYVCS
jgi:hypothetical protein